MLKKLILPILLSITPFAHAANDRPVLTTAGVVHVCPQNKIALIERGKAPFGFAMFGGHVEHETPQDAFKREANEELSISDITEMRLVGVHGNPGRDPRQHSVEVTYTCVTHDSPVAASDAKKVHLLSKEEVIKLIAEKNMAFDHGDILEKYLSDLGSCNPCNSQCDVGLPVDFS